VSDDLRTVHLNVSWKSSKSVTPLSRKNNQGSGQGQRCKGIQIEFKRILKTLFIPQSIIKFIFRERRYSKQTKIRTRYQNYETYGPEKKDINQKIWKRKSISQTPQTWTGLVRLTPWSTNHLLQQLYSEAWWWQHHAVGMFVNRQGLGDYSELKELQMFQKHPAEAFKRLRMASAVLWLYNCFKPANIQPEGAGAVLCWALDKNPTEMCQTHLDISLETWKRNSF